MTDLRPCFGKLLLDKAKEDKNVIAVITDTGYNIIDGFKENFPDRLFNLGICEQSAIGVAAGMALEGKTVFVYGITPFLLERPFEQVKLDIQQQGVKVILAGYDDFPEEGPTHNPLDIDKMMDLLGMVYFTPKTEEELTKDFKEALEYNGPSFIHIARK